MSFWIVLTPILIFALSALGITLSKFGFWHWLMSIWPFRGQLIANTFFAYGKKLNKKQFIYKICGQVIIEPWTNALISDIWFEFISEGNIFRFSPEEDGKETTPCSLKAGEAVIKRLIFNFSSSTKIEIPPTGEIVIVRDDKKRKTKTVILSDLTEIFDVVGVKNART